MERESRTGEEIITAIGDWNEPLLSRLCQPYSRNAQSVSILLTRSTLSNHALFRYFIVPEQQIRSLWDKAGLRTQPLRKHTFDHDDFVIKAKETISTWVKDNIKTDVRT